MAKRAYAKCPSCSRRFARWRYGETSHGKYKQRVCDRCGYIGSRRYY